MNTNSFEIPDAVILCNSRDSLPYWTLKNQRLSSELNVYPFGATVTKWRQMVNGILKDRLFLSGRSELTGKKPIRGGIPMIFPQFGNGPLPAHGFARNSIWETVGSALSADGSPSLTLRLSPTISSNMIWNYKFCAEQTITLGQSLTSSISVTNFGSEALSFQFAFHTYFSITDISAVRVHGLSGLSFIDKVRKQQLFTEECDELAIGSETDRIYISAPSTVTLTDLGDNSRITIAKNNLSDAVIWNPWIEKCRDINDLNPEDYKKFICCEAGQIEKPVTLQSSQTWNASQILTVN